MDTSVAAWVQRLIGANQESLEARRKLVYVMMLGLRPLETSSSAAIWHQIAIGHNLGFGSSVPHRESESCKRIG